LVTLVAVLFQKLRRLEASVRPIGDVKLRIHDATGCTTGCIVYTDIFFWWRSRDVIETSNF